MDLALSIFVVVGWGIFTPTPVESTTQNRRPLSGYFHDLELRADTFAVYSEDHICAGSDIENSGGTDYETCKTNCLDNINCHYFSHHITINGGTCWMFNECTSLGKECIAPWVCPPGSYDSQTDGDSNNIRTWKKNAAEPVPAPATTAPAPAPAPTATGDTLEGCGLAVMDKCYGHIPPDGSLPGNLIEEIGAVDDETTCQRFCKELYPSSCEWFMYDRTTNDCKLFKGSLSDLENDCTEAGYAIQPLYNDCKVTNINDHEGCYNFREDYCRFEFSLLDNLESIQTIEDCQVACNYLTNCTFFIYDTPSKTCKLDTASFDGRICDIVHGAKDPSLQECINDGKIPWKK